MGKLQNEDFKTEAELTGAGGTASQLLNDTKIYVTALGLNKTLDDAITAGDLSGGGGSGYSVTALKTSAHTASVGQFVPCDSSGGTFAVTLPTAVGNSGNSIKVQKVEASNIAVTISTTSGQTVGGRASGDVACYQLGDYVEVISNGSNWYILDKKETQHLQSSGSESFTNIGTAGNYGNISVSLALTYGVWELDSTFVLACGTGVAPAIINNTGFYAANGANSATQPTQLGSEVIGGTPLYTDLGGPITYNNTVNPGNNSRWSAYHNKITVSITSSQTVYLVPQIDYSSAGTASANGKMSAKRIW